MSENNDSADPDYCDTRPGKWVKVVRGMIQNLEFGEVQLSIHRGQVVEVRRLEKIRFEDSPARAPR